MSDPNFVQYIIDQCSGAGVITARKMFGDYGIYCNGTIVGLICDNRLYIKPTAAGRQTLSCENLQPPYEGAKPYFYIEEVDDRDYLAALTKNTFTALSEGSSQKKKQREKKK